MKLTDAQIELITNRLPHHTITNGTITTDLTTFAIEIEQITHQLDQQPYTQDNAREKFAAKYLHRKILKQIGQPIDAEADRPATDLEITIGSTVRLINDPDKQIFVVRSRNRDGSWCVYGGTTWYKRFRDFHTTRLTVA